MTAQAKAPLVNIVSEKPLADDLARILLTGTEIASRVADLGSRISHDYQGKDLVLVGVLKGVIFFLSDLSREISIPHSFDLVGAQSYKSGVKSSGQVSITKDIDLELQGRDVLLVEDIYDTGGTIHLVHDMIRMYRPNSLEVCTLLYKKCKRTKTLPIKYVGFEIEDVFVVGYGLDYKEKYRSLKCIGVLHPEVYQ
ncbi:hypoxanthine phosphoribosyltransferase [Candidatus Sumerlaeota bacterium]|nr:hypoxanthine phosphoribosyltransferase [Candidatus Sumerlaeota bacterium]MBI3735679.1 hypoxanthine phosphoribosyltransferase [Candidatus Sumerlaeota bacterium]